MKVDWNSKYTTLSVYSIITFAVCLSMVVFVQKFSVVSSTLSTITKALSPIIWGFVIAYLLNPVMMFCERYLKKLIERKRSHPKLVRGLSTGLSIIFGIAVISALISIIVPQVVDSIIKIFNNIQSYFNNIEVWVNQMNEKLAEYPMIVTFLDDQLESIKSAVMTAVNNIIPQVGNFAVKIKDGAVNTLIALKDFVIGFIVAVYFLADKEKFIAQAKKITTALFPQKVSAEIFRISSRTNHSLSGFISGKLIDSLIIGVICFIAMQFMGLEFAVLISTIIGITNVIPFFGPFIGAIPSALLLLVSAPKQTIPFIILILVLQQFDGNILGPKILGDSTGLPAFWVMFAILFGSGLFGFAGMLLGVPIFAVIYALVQEITEHLLKRKGLSVNTDDYAPIPVDPDSGEKNTNKNFKLKGGKSK
ncbi:MAG: AI-2E family transporter [Huintestinicola sp.]